MNHMSGGQAIVRPDRFLAFSQVKFSIIWALLDFQDVRGTRYFHHSDSRNVLNPVSFYLSRFERRDGFASVLNLASNLWFVDPSQTPEAWVGHVKGSRVELVFKNKL